MKEVFKKLLTVKSIVTLVLTGIFAYLCLYAVWNNQDIPQYFQTIYSVIIAFYFGTQYSKNEITAGTKNKEGA